jgi:hypothetical protein
MVIAQARLQMGIAQSRKILEMNKEGRGCELGLEMVRF